MNNRKQQRKCALCTKPCGRLPGLHRISLAQARALSILMKFELSSSSSSIQNEESKYVHASTCQACERWVSEAELVAKEWDHVLGKVRAVGSRLKEIVQKESEGEEPPQISLESLNSCPEIIEIVDDSEEEPVVGNREKAKDSRKKRAAAEGNVERCRNARHGPTTSTKQRRVTENTRLADESTHSSTNSSDHEEVTATGGQYLFYANSQRGGRFLYKLNWETKVSTRPYAFQLSREFSASVIVKNDLYDIGGAEKKYKPIFGDLSPGSKIVEIFRLGSEESRRGRRRGPKLLEGRKEFGACSVDDVIYVIGGCNRDQSMNTCEKLNINGKVLKWQAMDYLNKARGCHTTAVIEKKIYAIGGIGSETYDSVEILDTENPKGEWKYVKSLLTPRGRHASAVFNNMIYVLGGEDKTELPIKTGEVYDPSSDQWIRLPSMTHARRDFGVFNFDGRLIVIGGTETTSGPTGTRDLEGYDPREGKWQLIPWVNELQSTGKWYNAVSHSL